MAVAGLVLGIVAAIGAFIPFFNYVAWVIGVVGIIISVKARKEAVAASQPTGVPTAGLVLSIIGTALAFIGFICTLCVICAAGSAVGSLGGLF